MEEDETLFLRDLHDPLARRVHDDFQGSRERGGKHLPAGLIGKDEGVCVRGQPGLRVEERLSGPGSEGGGDEVPIKVEDVVHDPASPQRLRRQGGGQRVQIACVDDPGPPGGPIRHQ